MAAPPSPMARPHGRTRGVLPASSMTSPIGAVERVGSVVRLIESCARTLPGSGSRAPPGGCTTAHVWEAAHGGRLHGAGVTDGRGGVDTDRSMKEKGRNCPRLCEKIGNDLGAGNGDI